MIYFRSDYSLGAHPRILQALSQTNMVHTDGYSQDQFCYEAQNLLKKTIGHSNVDIHFLSGGTQVNLTAISSFLRPHHAVITVESAHICVHETGSIESTGHKVLYRASADGKLKPEQVEALVLDHKDEHMVKPKLVYISNATEIGTIYTKTELKALRDVCDQYDLLLYMDGARIGTALTALSNDLTLKDIADLTDAFYIGGTKNGAMFGEALVIVKDSLKDDFRYLMKQRGGMLAKGRLLGVQFAELFRDNLYFDLARHSNEMAARLRDGIIGGGYHFLVDSPTNQIFPILPNMVIEHLAQNFFFYEWEAVDDRSSAIRLVTSWGTTEEEVMTFLQSL